MMNHVYFSLSLLLVWGCSERTKLLHGNVKLVAKYNVLDEKLSPRNTKCSEEIKPFKEMGKHDCSFMLKQDEFDIEEKFVLDENGNLDEYWSYKSEGPIMYNRTELESDTMFHNLIDGQYTSITLLKDQNLIYDSGDTLKIEKVFFDEKLVFVQQKLELQKNHRRVIYQFE